MKNLQDVRIHSFAKINLFLNIVGKREDGYHNLETLFHSIGLHDEVIIRERSNSDIRIQCDHPNVPLDSQNIACRAATVMNDYVGGIGGLDITIKKRIPVSAGLGGGSANAAAVLYGLNELCCYELTQTELLQLGAKVGADVPFCLHGGAAFGTGIGDILTSLHPLTDISIVLINTGTAISTAEIFNNLNITLTNNKKESIIIRNCFENDDIVGVSKNLYNLLEIPIFTKYPELKALKTQLTKQKGCYGALMSGSGSTLYGIMKDMDAAEQCISYFKNNISLCIATATHPVGVCIA